MPAGSSDSPVMRQAAGENQPPGVFENLPRVRPNLRSPRRAAPVAPGPEPEPAPEQAPTSATGPARSRESEIAAVAEAGLALAGEVAILGLRLTTRATKAVRDAVERS